jgi:hypothetical protein
MDIRDSKSELAESRVGFAHIVSAILSSKINAVLIVVASTFCR